MGQLWQEGSHLGQMQKPTVNPGLQMATLCLDHFCSEGLGGKGQITVIVKMFKYALSVTGGCV